jgi:hypothetical protein
MQTSFRLGSLILLYIAFGSAFSKVFKEPMGFWKGQAKNQWLNVASFLLLFFFFPEPQLRVKASSFELLEGWGK